MNLLPLFWFLFVGGGLDKKTGTHSEGRWGVQGKVLGVAGFRSASQLPHCSRELPGLLLNATLYHSACSPGLEPWVGGSLCCSEGFIKHVTRHMAFLTVKACRQLGLGHNLSPGAHLGCWAWPGPGQVHQVPAAHSEESPSPS